MSDKIRLLIVDDNPDTQENLAKMLSFEKDMEIVGKALSGKEALEKVQQLKPHVALVDINMPEMDGLKTTEALLSRLPSLQVVIISVQGEQDYLRRAMLMGATDYLVKPFTSEELANSLRAVYQRRTRVPQAMTSPPSPVAAPQPEARVGKVVTIFSPKGGVGRTTIAVNLAMALKQETHQEVCLLDASLLFGDVGVMLNLPSKSSILDLTPHVEELDEELLESTLMTHSSGVKVLLAPPRPEQAELINEKQMGAILTKLRSLFDFLVIDTMPSFHEAILAILDYSDEIIVPISLEVSALKNAKLFLEIAEALGYGGKETVLVVNRADSSGGISPRDVEQSVRVRIAASIPNDWKLATFAANRGVPFVLSHKESQIARGIFQLASAVAPSGVETGLKTRR